MSTTTKLDWTIEWHGHTWNDADLTGQHLATLALISGDDRFEDLSITEAEVRAYPSLGYMRLINMLSAFVVVEATNGITDPDEAHDAALRALEQVQQASAADILAAVTFH